MSQVGINLQYVEAFTSEYPFLDRMKMSQATWMVRDANYNVMDVDTSQEVNGYFTSMPAGAANMVVAFPVDPATAGTTDQYVVTWEGQGSISFAGATVVSQGDHTVTISATGISANDGTWNEAALQINAIDASDPIHDIHIVRADQVDLYDSGQIFAPDFLDKVKQMSVVRFMDWGMTNGSNVVNWSDETQINDRTWASDFKSGVPISVMVELCNEAHVDMWYNIDAKANDDLVRQSLTYIHDHLDPSLNVHVEYTNEAWNWSFTQAGYLQQQADALWGHGGSVAGGLEVYYGYRAAQISAIAHDVWGDDAQARLDMVISTQTSPGMETYVFDGVAKAGLGTVDQLFHDYAIEGYFGNGFSDAGTNPTLAAQVVAWANAGAAGVNAAFAQLANGGSVIGDSLAAMAQIYQYEGQVAHAHGLNLVAYEGGPSFYNYFPASEQGLVAGFFNTLLNDPRMATLYAQNVANFDAAGGDLFNGYQDTGGIFGTLGDIYQDENARWNAYTNSNTEYAQGQNLTSGNGGGTLTGGAGSDWLVGGNGADVLNGNGGRDTISGGNGDDRISGGDGDDYLDGGLGHDTMVGGAGDDIYITDSVHDDVQEAANGGYDTIRTTSRSWVLQDNVEQLEYTGTSSFTGTGNALDNIIQSGRGNDTLHGGAGNDTLQGGAGNDVLDGGDGTDVLIGGVGNDTYYVYGAQDTPVENANEGNDTIITTESGYILSANFENLTFIGTGGFNGQGNASDNKLTGGSTGDYLSGLDGHDHLYGMDGDDILDGGVASDYMAGGKGNDTYYVDTRYDQVIENANEGWDQVFANIAYTLPNNVEGLTLLGTRGNAGYGNALDNSIWGNIGANHLYGYDGADNLYGGDGNDVLDGGNGNDNLQGGTGHDVLTGGSGDDTMNGGTGADDMAGGTGNDTYYVDSSGDTVTEGSNAGTDIVYASVNFTLSANVENLTMQGGATSGIGNASDNQIYDATGSASGTHVLSGLGGNDVLLAGPASSILDGGTGNDAVYGNAGNDTIIGGPGVDQMAGGAGADTFVFKVGDIATSGGVDWIRDFNHGEGDKVDLSAYESQTNGHGLTFIGTDAFTGVAGQINAVEGGGTATLYIDLNGDRHADLMINMNISQLLSASDFIL